MTVIRRIANRFLRAVGLKIIPLRHDELHYQYDYAGGFAAYRETQIRWNKAKLDWVWADPLTLEQIASDIERHALKTGICHGARNGFEVKWFRERLKTDVIGTDISETATEFPDMVVHDFHEARADWVGKFDFVYTNSLDQAFDPERALNAWADQLTSNGRIYIEHTLTGHSAAGASEMDPFGAHPMIMPYLLFEWGRGKYQLADILHTDGVSNVWDGKEAPKGHVWIFVLGKAGDEASSERRERSRQFELQSS